MINIKRFKLSEKILILVIILLLLHKLLLLFLKGPIFTPDSPHYMAYSENISNGQFASPDAMRTPGYPFFMSSVNFFGHNNYVLIAAIQIALGLLSLFLLYKILSETKYKNAAIGTLALVYMSSVSFYDLKILSESFSYFLFILFLFILIKQAFGPVLRYTLLSLASSVLILTRPQFIIVFAALSLFLAFNKKFLLMAVILVSTILTVFCYSYFNYITNNYFGMSIFISYNIVNHTGYYIEDAEEENPVLVNTYIEYRNKWMEKNNKSQEFTIGQFKDSICQKLNINNVELSKQLSVINNYLIIHHPLKYANTLKYNVRSLFFFSDEEYDKKFNLPLKYINYFLNLCFIAGLALTFYKIKDNDYFTRMMITVFFSNFILVILIDSGETFRHIHFTLFITLMFLVDFAGKLVDKYMVKNSPKL